MNVYKLILVAAPLFVFSCASNEKEQVIDSSPAIPVKISQVTATNNGQFLSISGKIQAVNNADLSTRTMGFVNKVHVAVGDEVRKGQLLVSINNSDLQAKKAQVDASITEITAVYSNAEKDYNRFKSLFADRSASQKELDDMATNFSMAKARLEAAKQMKNEINAQFAYTNISAPFSGVVTSKSVETGDMASPGQPLISIESPGNFEVIAMVPETEISQIKKDQEVNVFVKSINQSFNGKIVEVSSSAKHTGGQYLVKVDLGKAQANILSGMFATVQFSVEKQTTTSMVLVPLEAIVTKGQLSGVYTINQSNTALLRWLRLGRVFGNQVEVLSGLNKDESYILSSEGKLYNGIKVSIQ